jgi:hypothetical protein
MTIAGPQLLHSQIDDRRGEEAAASQIRSRKRRMTATELERDADDKRRIKAGSLPPFIASLGLWAERRRRFDSIVSDWQIWPRSSGVAVVSNVQPTVDQ